MPAAADHRSEAYLRSAVLTAPPEQLRLMLLDGALRFARRAREALAAGRFEESYEARGRCRDILVELITTIHDEADPVLASRVRGVLTFIYAELVRGATERDPGRIDRAIGLLEYERETWSLLIRRLADERAGGGRAVSA